MHRIAFCMLAFDSQAHRDVPVTYNFVLSCSLVIQPLNVTSFYIFFQKLNILKTQALKISMVLINLVLWISFYHPCQSTYFTEHGCS